MTSFHPDRRSFLKRTTTGALGLALASGSMPERVLGANDRIRIGLIGCGDRGNQLMAHVLELAGAQNAEIAALSDVWTVSLERTRANLSKQQRAQPMTFTRHADLLARDDIDAVIIATPDFSHTPILIEATKAGKDAYVEKPMACKLLFANEALKLVRQQGTVVQVGTQFRSEKRHQAAAPILQSGVLGTISKVETSYNDSRPRWRRDFGDVRREDVDWDQFLMYLPDEPFNPERFRRWQWFKDFTTGTPGLLGAHRIDVATWFLGDPLPRTAVASGGVYVWKDGREHADTLDALYEFPSGCLLQYTSRLANNYPTPGVIFYGTKGTFDTTSWTLRGEGAGEGALQEAITVPPQGGDMGLEHVRNWLECIRTRETPNAPVEAGYAHSVAGIMAYEAWNTGQRHVFDPVRQEIKPG